MNKPTILQIKKILEDGHSLTFTSESSGQGGEKVIVSLNEKHIGEVYTWDSDERRHRNIRHGNDAEVQLASDIKDWIYEGFFTYVTSRDIICDSYRCEFEIDDGVLGLSFSGESYYDGVEQSESGGMVLEDMD